MKTLILPLILSSCSLQVSFDPVQMDSSVAYRVKANASLISSSEYNDDEGQRKGDSTAGKIVIPVISNILKFFGI